MSAESIPTAVAVCEFICKSIVANPDEVDIDVQGGDGRYEITVSVGEGDTGRVIGRRGRTAHAIRAVVRAAAAKDDAEVGIEFAD